jgi:hypothetical protein
MYASKENLRTSAMGQQTASEIGSPIGAAVDQTGEQLNELQQRISFLADKLEHYSRQQGPVPGNRGEPETNLLCGFHERVMNLRTQAMTAVERINNIIERLAI